MRGIPEWAADLVECNLAPSWLWWDDLHAAVTNAALRDLLATVVAGAVDGAPLDLEPWSTLRVTLSQPDVHHATCSLVISDPGGPEQRFYAVSSIDLPGDGTGDHRRGGMLCTLVDTTVLTLAGVSRDALHDLERGALVSRTVDAACASAITTLGANRDDLPFALIYLIDPDRRGATLSGSFGVERAVTRPDTVALTDATVATGWPLARVLAGQRGEILTQLSVVGASDAAGEPHLAVALPITVDDGVGAFLCAGIAPLRRLDPALRRYLDRAVDHIGTGISSARDHVRTARELTVLRTVDRDKTRFFTDVAHELRTPLVLATTAIEDALIDAGPGMQRDRLTMAHRNVQRLHKVSSSLLDFARIEADQVRACYAPTDLARLTAEVASSFQTLCDNAGLWLRIDCPPLAEPVYVDQQMWERILLNLLSNAFKFTVVGRIEVALRYLGDVVELSVTDTGCGIAAEHLPRVFDRFYRIERGPARTAEGTGIGLTIVRELARLHGGDATVDSTLGGGSRFCVTIRTGTADLPTELLGDRHRVISHVTRSAFVQEASQWIGDPIADRVPAARRATAGAVGRG